MNFEEGRQALCARLSCLLSVCLRVLLHAGGQASESLGRMKTGELPGTSSLLQGQQFCECKVLHGKILQALSAAKIFSKYFPEQPILQMGAIKEAAGPAIWTGLRIINSSPLGRRRVDL